MMRARDYQQHANDCLHDYFAQGGTGHPLVLMPTGTGKSVNIALFLQSAMRNYSYLRAMVLTHVETLIAQNAQRLKDFWPTAPIGIHSAAFHRRDTHQQLIFGGIQSCYKHPEAFGFVDVIIVDEAHLVSDKDETMYVSFLNALLKINPNLRVIGFTATGWRLTSGRLVNGPLFTDIAIDMTTPAYWKWFIEEGYLSPLYAKETKLRLSEEGIDHRGGEFVLAQQQEVVDKEKITRAAIEEILYKGSDRTSWLIFATGINHCENIAEMLNEYDVSAIPIHSKHKDGEIRIADFKARKYRAAVNMNMLTTGVDVPHIDLIGGLRFTESSGLWVQMLGRGARPAYAPGYNLETREGRLAAIAAGPKPNGCMVLDFAHNTERLGTIANPNVRERTRAGKPGGGKAIMRVCPHCAEYCHASVKFCPACGFEFVGPVHIQATASELDVMGLETEENKVERFAVDRITYKVYRRHGSSKPPVLCVTYYVGLLKHFQEFICPEHDGGRASHARRWWLQRVPPGMEAVMPIPVTAYEARDMSQRLMTPKSINVWINKKPKPQVMDYEF